MNNQPFILLWLILLGFTSCKNSEEKKEIDNSSPKSSLLDSAVNQNERVSALNNVYQTKEEKNLTLLLSNPLDLKDFKQRAGGANGGVRKRQSFYHKPDTSGTYFEYFWFHALRRQYGEGKSVNYLFVETYIYGNKIGNYNKVEEELISLRAMASHASLGELNLVEKSRMGMEEAYGKAHIEHLGTSVYYNNEVFLIVHYNADKIDWFKYLKTNLELNEINMIPTEYFEYKGEYSK